LLHTHLHERVPPFFIAKGHTVTVGQFAVHSWKHNSKRCAELPAVLCGFCSVYRI
jgi:hypothetical protein